MKKYRHSLTGTVGFVPTMGALHRGHIFLIQKSIKEADLTVCSIFVNPTQFNDPADFDKYPSTVPADVEKLYLGSDGSPVTPGIYTRDTIDEAFGFNIYKKFIGPFCISASRVVWPSAKRYGKFCSTQKTPRCVTSARSYCTWLPARSSSNAWPSACRPHQRPVSKLKLVPLIANSMAARLSDVFG